MDTCQNFKSLVWNAANVQAIDFASSLATLAKKLGHHVVIILCIFGKGRNDITYLIPIKYKLFLGKGSPLEIQRILCEF